VLLPQQRKLFSLVPRVRQGYSTGAFAVFRLTVGRTLFPCSDFGLRVFLLVVVFFIAFFSMAGWSPVVDFFALFGTSW
jgi:hypothetical protein